MAEGEGYLGLEVYHIAHDLALQIHAMTLKLPSFEHFEEGSQIRKSSKSCVAQIVEGHGQRKFKDAFLHYLHRAKASADETREHLRLLHESGSFNDLGLYGALAAKCDKLTAKMATFIISVEHSHTLPFYLRPDGDPQSRSEEHTSELQ